jgi:hypothetical protein
VTVTTAPSSSNCLLNWQHRSLASRVEVFPTSRYPAHTEGHIRCLHGLRHNYYARHASHGPGGAVDLQLQVERKSKSCRWRVANSFISSLAGSGGPPAEEVQPAWALKLFFYIIFQCIRQVELIGHQLGSVPLPPPVPEHAYCTFDCLGGDGVTITCREQPGINLHNCPRRVATAQALLWALLAIRSLKR